MHYPQLNHNILLGYRIMLFYFLNKNYFEGDYGLNYFHITVFITIYLGVIV